MAWSYFEVKPGTRLQASAKVGLPRAQNSWNFAEPHARYSLTVPQEALAVAVLCVVRQGYAVADVQFQQRS